MESTDVLLEWTCELHLDRAHLVEAMLDSPENERERAAAMWQYDVQSRKLVQRAGRDELCCRRGMFEGKAKPVREAGRPDKPFAVKVRLAIEWVEQERITQFLTSREDRLKGGFE